VQVSGKLRARLQVARDANEDEVLREAHGDDRVRAALAGRPVARIVFVPGRLLNLVPEGRAAE
jgi:leucyl-tRNA synthetase